MTDPERDPEHFLDELAKVREKWEVEARTSDARAADDPRAVRRAASYTGQVTAVGGATKWFREQRAMREAMIGPAAWQSIAEMAMEPAITGLLTRVAMNPAGILPPTTFDAVRSLDVSGMGVAATVARTWGAIEIGGVASVLQGDPTLMSSGGGVAEGLERILRATPGTAIATAAIVDVVEDIAPEDDPSELFDQIENRRRRLRLRPGFLHAVLLSMAIERLDSAASEALGLDEHGLLVGLVLLWLAMVFVDSDDSDHPG